MSAEKVLVPLAEGFEETEAVAIVDVLRRAGLDVVTASLGDRSVRGAHGIVVEADRRLAEVDGGGITALVLPGGLPGTTNLRDDPRVIELAQRLAGEGRLTAAVCAAPQVLAAAGLLDGGVEFTCYPGAAAELEGLTPVEGRRVVRSGSVITSQGPGTAIEFALEVVAALAGESKAAEVGEAMLVRGGS